MLLIRQLSERCAGTGNQRGGKACLGLAGARNDFSYDRKLLKINNFYYNETLLSRIFANKKLANNFTP
jgi:hypothetical protein